MRIRQDLANATYVSKGLAAGMEATEGFIADFAASSPGAVVASRAILANYHVSLGNIERAKTILADVETLLRKWQTTTFWPHYSAGWLTFLEHSKGILLLGQGRLEEAERAFLASVRLAEDCITVNALNRRRGRVLVDRFQFVVGVLHFLDPRPELGAAGGRTQGRAGDGLLYALPARNVGQAVDAEVTRLRPSGLLGAVCALRRSGALRACSVPAPEPALPFDQRQLNPGRPGGPGGPARIPPSGVPGRDSRRGGAGDAWRTGFHSQRAGAGSGLPTHHCPSPRPVRLRGGHRRSSSHGLRGGRERSSPCHPETTRTSGRMRATHNAQAMPNLRTLRANHRWHDNWNQRDAA